LKVRFKASFAKDLRALKDKALLERINELIANIEAAQSLPRCRTSGSCTAARNTIA